MAFYEKGNGQDYINTAIVLVSASPLITLETKTPVHIQNGMVCGAIRYEDIAKGKIVFDGRTLPAKEAAPMLDRLAQNLSLMMNKDICTAYDVTPTGRVAKLFINGAYASGDDQKVLWVKPSDGYRVAP